MKVNYHTLLVYFRGGKQNKGVVLKYWKIISETNRIFNKKTSHFLQNA
jgi:hypothetical protein